MTKHTDIELIKKEMEHNNEKLENLDEKQDKLCVKIDNLDDKVVKALRQKVNRAELKEFKDDFYYWRNLLVGGLLLGIFMMILSTIIS